MSPPPMDIVILGLSITSSWGNGHATTYRGLVKALVERGHRVLFLERDVPWYAAHRDPSPSIYWRTELYHSVPDLQRRFLDEVRSADLVIVGSYVPEGIAVGEWVLTVAQGLTAFYDIDTPVTLAALRNGGTEYLTADQIRRYPLYLSFTGGPTLRELEQSYGSPCARALYCSFDPRMYHPETLPVRWDLGYMGTYSEDRQPALERLLLEPSRMWPEGHFAVAGPRYPDDIAWPRNVHRIDHLPPERHNRFYNAQRFTLNLTRADMIAAGYSPSVRLFEAAACGVPIITDYWAGLETFFDLGDEILVAWSADETLAYLREIPEPERGEIGKRARARVLAEHTAAHRARELEAHVLNLTEGHVPG